MLQRSTQAQPVAGARSGRIPALDGVRGIAILAVCALHMSIIEPACRLDRVWLRAAEFGWAGVDLFFVLSGFLITGILLDSKAGPNYFRNFYARRVLRIFPLYYAILVMAFLVLPHVDALQHSLGLGDASPASYWTYLCNFSMARHHEFPWGPLAVTWSLAIEEQFYLIWPAVVLVLNREQLIRMCLMLGLSALFVRGMLEWHGAHWISIYVLTPCRMDSLTAGALVAAAVRRQGGVNGVLPVAWRCALGAAALAIGLTAWQGTRWDLAAPGTVIGFSILAVLFASLLPIAISLPTQHPVARALAGRTLGLFGVLSYGMYLFHDPVLRLVKSRIFNPAQFPMLRGSRLPGQLLFYVIALPMTTGLAWVSWNLFESWFLRLKDFFPSRGRQVAVIGSSPLPSDLSFGLETTRPPLLNTSGCDPAPVR